MEHRETSIGSVGAGAQSIVLADPAVSQQHARIERRGGVFHLIDLGATNGTYVNSLAHRTIVLCGDDKLRFGNSEAVFRLG